MPIVYKQENQLQVHDIVTDPINSSYDLIISRHTTQHLKTKDVLKVLQNFITSKSLYLFTSNYPDVKVSSYHLQSILHTPIHPAKLNHNSHTTNFVFTS